MPAVPRNVEQRTGLSMGESAALTAVEWGIGREEQDELTVASHRRLAAAYERGFFDDLMTPYLGLERDQNLRADTTVQQLAKLRPVVGGAAVLGGVCPAPRLGAAGEPRLARDRGRRLLASRAGLGLQDFDFFEIHEAFAAQVLATLRAWEDPIFCKQRLGLDAPLGAVDRDRLNVAGSSLAERGSGRGLVSICGAGGQGVTAILQR